MSSQHGLCSLHYGLQQRPIPANDAVPQQGTFPTPPAPVDPREDFARLLRDAAEGLPVAGRVPTWEADRPKTLPVGEPIKVRWSVPWQLRP